MHIKQSEDFNLSHSLNNLKTKVIQNKKSLQEQLKSKIISIKNIKGITNGNIIEKSILNSGIEEDKKKLKNIK